MKGTFILANLLGDETWALHFLTDRRPPPRATFFDRRSQIVNRFPKHLSLGQVHLALAHYYLAEKKAVDDELAAEFRFYTRDALAGSSMSLPSVRAFSPLAPPRNGASQAHPVDCGDSVPTIHEGSSGVPGR